MGANLRYLLFGLCVLASYWFVAHNGIVFFGGDGPPSPPSARVGRSSGPRPTFWSTGYQGGK
jgi:hypothetical protein